MLMHGIACGRRTPSASLVLAWEKKIYLMDVPLAAAAQPTSLDPASPSPRAPATPRPARVLKSWDIEHVVSNCYQVLYCLACCQFLHWHAAPSKGCAAMLTTHVFIFHSQAVGQYISPGPAKSRLAPGVSGHFAYEFSHKTSICTCSCTVQMLHQTVVYRCYLQCAGG